MDESSSVSPMVFLLLEQMVISGLPAIVSAIFDAAYLYTDVTGYRCQFGPNQYMIFRYERLKTQMIGWGADNERQKSIKDSD